MLIKEINEQQEMEANGEYDAERARASSFNLTNTKKKSNTKKGCCKWTLHKLIWLNTKASNNIHWLLK